jgi:hypothetical protein
MQKRGNILTSKKSSIVTAKTLMALFEILLFITTYLILLSQLNGIKTNNVFEQIYLSRDLALLVDVLQSSPGDIEYNYDNDIVSKFKYTFKDGEAAADFETVRKSFPYSRYNSIKSRDATILNPESIIFRKKNNEFNIDKK